MPTVIYVVVEIKRGLAVCLQSNDDVGMKLLLVEDNRELSSWLTRLLDQSGYAVEQAFTGDQADTLSAKFTPGGKFDYELGWQTMNADNAGLNGKGYVMNAFASTADVVATGTGKRKTWYGSVFFHFDKRTELYFALDHLSTDGTYKASQANGFDSQNEAAVGMRFKF